METTTILIIVIGLLLCVIGLCIFVIRNFIIKESKYDTAMKIQVNYLQNLSETLYEGHKHLSQLDDRGVFQSDDEVGEFFDNMKKVQTELNKFILPSNYGQEKVQ
jgi:Na+-transporting NADH:ubiquinone oxidoreductase subunit NqrF